MMRGERGYKIFNMVWWRGPHLSSSRTIGKKKRKKKSSIHVRGSVGSLALAGYDAIEVK